MSTPKKMMFVLSLAVLCSARRSMGDDAFASSPVSRGSTALQPIIDSLDHQERLVKSMVAEFERSALPTAEADKALIPEILGRFGQAGEADRFIKTKEAADEFHAVVRWQRNDIMERSDFYAATDGSISPGKNASLTEAFDGRLFRSLSLMEKTPFGKIETMDGAHWNQQIRLTPFSVYEMRGQSLSSFLRESTDVKVESTADSGITVTATNSRFPSWFIILSFNAKHELVSRVDGSRKVEDGSPRFYQQDKYSDYRDFAGPGGETIHYPMELHSEQLAGGRAADGRLVPWYTEVLRVKNVEFNVPIADETFKLTFPPNTRIWDGVGGAGMVDRTTLAGISKNIEEIGIGAKAATTTSTEATTQEGKPLHLPGVTPASATPNSSIAVSSQHSFVIYALLGIASLVGISLAFRWYRQKLAKTAT